MYANNVAGLWDISTIDSTGFVGWYTSLMVDAFDNVHISYYDVTNRDLKYATNALSGDWSIMKADSAGRVGEYTSLKVDAKGFVHIAYYDRSNTDLKYARSLLPYGLSNYRPMQKSSAGARQLSRQ